MSKCEKCGYDDKGTGDSAHYCPSAKGPGRLIDCLNCHECGYSVTGDGEYNECSGDPASCPENEGYGCCKPNPITEEPARVGCWEE